MSQTCTFSQCERRQGGRPASGPRALAASRRATPAGALEDSVVSEGSGLRRRETRQTYKQRFWEHRCRIFPPRMICLPNTCLECGGGGCSAHTHAPLPSQPPPRPRGCSAVNGGIICQLWQCLEAASERYKEATDKESIRRAVNCLQSPGAGEYLKSMGLKAD